MIDLSGKGPMRGRLTEPHSPCQLASQATGTSPWQRTGVRLQPQIRADLLLLLGGPMTGLLLPNQTRARLPRPTWQRLGMLRWTSSWTSLMRGQHPQHHQASAASEPAGLPLRKVLRQGMSRVGHTSPTPCLPHSKSLTLWMRFLPAVHHPARMHSVQRHTTTMKLPGPLQGLPARALKGHYRNQLPSLHLALNSPYFQARLCPKRPRNGRAKID